MAQGLVIEKTLLDRRRQLMPSLSLNARDTTFSGCLIVWSHIPTGHDFDSNTA